jgi:hypothetical protein
MQNNKNPKHVFRELLKRQSKSLIPIQTYWVVVKSVDWEEKTMIATGIANELPFYDVLLGLGGFYRKPKIGTSCLIGVIENQESITFLLDCDQLDEAVYISGESSWTMNTGGFIINQSGENLAKCMGDLIDEINKIVIIYGNDINRPAMNAIKKRIQTILK